mgnify:FL=1
MFKKLLTIAVILFIAAGTNAKEVKNMETIKLVYPVWQGGVNPDYYLGSKLLSVIVPENKNIETVEISVNTNFTDEMKTVDGVDYGDILLSQKQETHKVLNEKNPKKIIVIGGDCSVSEAPFDYLHSIYGDKLGILWLDAHPDVSDTKNSSHLHEMVLGNLLGLSQKSDITRVGKPFAQNKVMFAGLIEKDLRTEAQDSNIKNLNIKIAAPEQLAENSELILNWIKENNIKYLAIHWDLDVLSKEDYRSNTQSKPHMTKAEYPAAMGELSLNQVARILKDVSCEAEIVGLTIAEHMPYDAINLRNILKEVSIFK